MGRIDHPRTRRNLIQFVDEDRAFFRQVGHNIAVMHNLLAHVDRGPERLQRDAHNINGANNPCAEAPGLEQKHSFRRGRTGCRIDSGWIESRCSHLSSIPRIARACSEIEPSMVQFQCPNFSGFHASFAASTHRQTTQTSPVRSAANLVRHEVPSLVYFFYLHLLRSAAIMTAVALQRDHAGRIGTGRGTILFTCRRHTATTSVSAFFRGRRIRHKSSTTTQQETELSGRILLPGDKMSSIGCFRSNSPHDASWSR